MITAYTKEQIQLASKINYLNNRDLLREIHKSKSSYCSFLDEDYANYDMILPSVEKINRNTIAEARRNRSDRLARIEWEREVKLNPKVKLDSFKVDPKKIPNTDLVFRIMTFDHIPLAPGRKKTPKSKSDHHAKVNFPPFQHFKINENNEPYCVGKSHWVGGLENGHFSKDDGKMTNELAKMFIKLCERYGTRGNWRGYCVDTQTEALTQRGWLSGDQISENDTILSFNSKQLAWSSIKSIYRGNFDGLMHKLDSRSIDALITPGHKLVTGRGLVKVEHLLESDKVIVMGDEVPGPEVETYNDAFVELAGWIVTEGCYEFNANGLKRITVYQNEGPNASRIRATLSQLQYTYTESLRDENICFSISRKDSREISEVMPTKNFTPEFLLSLTSTQRDLLINTMVDGDGWVTANKYKRFVQKDKARVDMFQMLCSLAGVKTNAHLVEDHISFGKETSYYQVNLFTKRGNTTNGSVIDMHGGKSNGKNAIGQGKEKHPNMPTTPYKGEVWCPETEYGSFLARRNGKVYLTGNTYNDEMRSQALLQLSQVGLQFDESKSSNPFAYYTATITNSFTRILNLEKRNQSMRDNILEMNNMTPSYTRQAEWGMGGGRGPDD